MKAMLAIPSYSWAVRTGTLRSLLNDTVELVKRGDTFALFDEAGNTNLQKARRIIIEAFRESDCDFLVFIDDDVFWEAGALLKLLDYPVDFVAGVYPRRKDPLDFPVGWLPDPEKKGLRAVNGLLEVAHAPGGFWRLSRACVDRMWANYGNTLFNRVDDERGEYSEDISFCGRWRAIGGQVWIDPEIAMGHIGPKAFTGCIGDWLRNR